MARRLPPLIRATALGLLAILPAQAWAAAGQASPGQATTPAPPPAQKVPISDAEFERIRQALKNEPTFNIDDTQLRFYVKVLAKQPTFAQWVKGSDLMNGPVKRANMTHQEFLNMVTPKELHSSGGITATEMLSSAITNWLGQALVRRMIDELKGAKDDREAQEIRDRINRELAALRGD